MHCSVCYTLPAACSWLLTEHVQPPEGCPANADVGTLTNAIGYNFDSIGTNITSTNITGLGFVQAGMHLGAAGL
jgi:hypothetical protein